jgi:hypothetical protein
MEYRSAVARSVQGLDAESQQSPDLENRQRMEYPRQLSQAIKADRVSPSPSKYCAQCPGPQDLPTRLLGSCSCSRSRSFSLHTHPSSSVSHVPHIELRTFVAEWAAICCKKQ